MPFMRQSNLGMKIRNWWRFFSKKWEVILREDGFFLLWMLIFSCSALGARFITLEAASGTAELIGKIIKLPLHLLLGWAEIFLLVFLLSYLPRKLRRIVQWLFLIISGALFISDVFLLYSFGDVLDQAKIEIVMGTNPRTVLEFLQIYGYHLPTTPNLQQRLQQGNLFVFDDTLAPDTNTTGSMRKIFTFAEKDEEEPWNDI